MRLKSAGAWKSFGVCRDRIGEVEEGLSWAVIVVYEIVVG